jgi:hypothetical protein
MPKYWAYLNGQVQGPYDPAELKRLPGFGRGTWVYPDNLAGGTENDWKSAFQIPELSPIPFTQLRPPAVNPVKAFKLSAGVQAQSPVPKTEEPVDRELAADAEKTRLMEQVKSLERELKNIQNQSSEIDKLKLQLREKDQAMYNLLAELDKTRQLVSLAKQNTETAQVTGEPRVNSQSENYVQLDVPILKIVLIVLGTLAFLFSLAWFVPQFRNRLRGVVSGTAAVGEPADSEQTDRH